jgi:hypothetical protein
MRFYPGRGGLSLLPAALAASVLLAACGGPTYAARAVRTRRPATVAPVASSDTFNMPEHPVFPILAHRVRPHKRRRVVVQPPPPSTTVVTSTTVATGNIPPPGSGAPGLVAGRVTIFGDSVTIDAAPDLLADIKGSVVDAVVGEQWYQGVAEAQSLKSEGQLGAVVVVALGTNGPLTWSDITQMMQVLSGCSRVVLVTNHVPDYWQNPNNALLEQAAQSYKNVVVANWEALAAANPGWFYADGTHMPIGGPGAQAFAQLVASKVD